MRLLAYVIDVLLQLNFDANKLNVKGISSTQRTSKIEFILLLDELLYFKSISGKN